MVDEVPELVEEAERHPPVAPRDPQVDRVAVAGAVAPGLARRRRRPHGHSLDVGVEEVEALGGSKRSAQLRVQRAPPRQRHDLFQRTQTGKARTADGSRGTTSTAHRSTLRPRADGADIRSVRLALVLLVPLLLFSGWQFLRREQNESRLALAASEIALRDVEVSC